MYKRDKIILVFVMIAVGGLAYFFKLDYKFLSMGALTVVAVFMVVYTTSFSGLVGTNLAKKMKETQDKTMKDKTELGVLRAYYNYSFVFVIITIVLSCICEVLNEYIDDISKEMWYVIFSAVSYAFFLGNICLAVIVNRFMMNRQLWDA